VVFNLKRRTKNLRLESLISCTDEGYLINYGTVAPLFFIVVEDFITEAPILF